MADEGKNKVASSLLDLQPTAILELYKIYPDRINKPTTFIGFHGGSIYNQALVWQGIQYLPLAFESEGFDILGDGKLARPKIRVANKNNLITNLLQNNKDLINAKVIRKRVSVKFLDDENFDGGNPFGVADPKAELANETWLMGRKTAESQIFVEFELNSQLDLESFSVNSRGITAKYCPWQYRGEGCRYMGHPIERDDGLSFEDSDGNSVIPNAWKDQRTTLAQTDFMFDTTAQWDATHNYTKGNIVWLESPTIVVPTFNQEENVNVSGNPLKTAFVAVKGLPDNDNLGQHPEGNPSYWQKDGCTKRLKACRKRFNDNDKTVFVSDSSTAIQTFPAVQISGGIFNQIPSHTGYFHSHAPQLTGALTGDFTVVGWANMNTLSPYGAGLFSTSQRDDGSWPKARYYNIGAAVTPKFVDPGVAIINPDFGGLRAGAKSDVIEASYIGFQMSGYEDGNADATKPEYEPRYRNVALALQEDITAEPGREWIQYIVTHETGIAPETNSEGEPLTANERVTKINFYTNDPKDAINSVRGARRWLGNFASIEQRTGDDYWKPRPDALPQTFMLGAVEHWQGISGYELTGVRNFTSMNGCLGPWALWNRVLNGNELEYLRKTIQTPQHATNTLTHVPRLYSECTGFFSTLTGGTGDGLALETPDAQPLLYASGSLVAWWDGTTGNTAIGNGLLDIHTGGLHLTGSGEFSGISESYIEGDIVVIENPTDKDPRFGGFPGTDGFSYGRTTNF